MNIKKCEIINLIYKIKLYWKVNDTYYNNLLIVSVY